MPRLAIQDQKSSLSFNGTNSKVAITTPANCNNLVTSSVSFWMKYNADTTASAMVFHKGGNAVGFYDVSLSTGVITFIADWSGNDQNQYYRIGFGGWNHLVLTYSGIVGERFKLYVNGSEVSTATVTDSTGTRGADNTALAIGNRTTDTARAFNGLLKNMHWYNRVLTAAEATQLYNGVSPTSGLIGQWFMNEGAGTVLTDSSGNNNNGTITNGTWVSDTPTKKRKVVGGNLVFNGDFEYAPPTNVAQTTMSRWLDGTATGSTTNTNFGVYVVGGGGASAQFDSSAKASGNNSIKTSLPSPGLWVNAYLGTGIGSPANYISVLPNTSYTLTGSMRTNYVSGDSNGGASIGVNQYTGSLAYVSGAFAASIKTTTDWARYTVTFTTGSTARYVRPLLSIVGDTGAATLIMDAWSDDITLTPTTPDTRLAVVDRKSSLFLNGTTTNVAVPYTLPATGTISVWVNPSKLYDYVSMWSTSGASDKWECWLYYNGRIAARTGASALIGDGIIPNAKNSWYHVCQTWVSGGVSKLFINGAVFGSTQSTVNAYSGTTFYWGGDGTLNSLGCGNMSDGRIYTTALSDREVLKLYKTGISSVAPAVWNKLDEGAGTTAYDSSGNGNHGTITAGTYTSDVPTKKREVVGGNMVYNGDFSYTPPAAANVATTATAKYIDGTAGGGTTRSFIWFSQIVSGTGSYLFDTATMYKGKPTMKLTTDAGAFIGANYIGGAGSAVLTKLNGIPCLPNTSYTLTGVIKTNVLSGSATTGAYIRVSEYDGAGSSVISYDTTAVKTTTDFTEYTKVFTTSATTRFLNPQIFNKCSDGAATLALEAWFADITLTPTTNTVRGITS